MIKEIEGDLFKIIQTGEYDVVIQGCNCLLAQASGIAPQFVEAFQTDEFAMEQLAHPMNASTILAYNKLGCIDFEDRVIDGGNIVSIVNCYTQYFPGKNGDYLAVMMCFQKLNKLFAGRDILSPLIGCGIAGLDFSQVKQIAERYLKNVNITFVHYKK